MGIKYVKGDLLQTSGLNALAHGCNCAGAMGKGIAVGFKERWPKMYLAYKDKCRNGDFDVGDVFLWEECGYTIFNLGTQKSWKIKATKDALVRSIDSMLAIAESRSIRQIGMPMIGAGLGGLNGLEVKEVVSELVEGYNVDLIVFEKYVPMLDAADLINNR